jgi:hypothetical protein
MLKTSLRAHSIYITPNYLNALFERVILQYYSTQPRDHYFSSITSPIKRRRVVNVDALNHLNELYDPEVDPLRITLFDVERKDPPPRPERFSFIEFRRDLNLVIHTGQMSDLYEANMSWENDAQFCFYQENSLIDQTDVDLCMKEVFGNGQTINKMETIIEAQLE